MPTPSINSIGLFIDGGYYAKIKEGLQKHLNLHNLTNYVQLAIANRFDLDPSSCIVTESHFFQGRFPAHDSDANSNIAKRAFEDELIEEDVSFHYKHIHRIAGKYQEKGIDVWFALETFELTLYRDLDFVVLITGDADHEMLARKIKSLKRQVVLLTWNVADQNSTSRALKEECTFHIDLKQLTKKSPHLNDVLTMKNKIPFSEMVSDNELPYL